MTRAATLKVEGLSQLVKALTNVPKIRVGIIGDPNRTKAEGEKSAPTNAEIGAAHEYGSKSRNLPPRSFLRIPISDNLQNEMEASRLLDQDTLNAVIKQGSIVPWLDQVAISAEACVADAFATGGNGKWPAWKNPNYSNNAGQILVDTTQLRNSILSDIDGDIRKRVGEK